MSNEFKVGDILESEFDPSLTHQVIKVFESESQLMDCINSGRISFDNLKKWKQSARYPSYLMKDMGRKTCFLISCIQSDYFANVSKSLSIN